jgi:hypothetical protein
MRAALQLDLVCGRDVTDELAANDGVLHLDLGLYHTGLADMSVSGQEIDPSN